MNTLQIIQSANKARNEALKTLHLELGFSSAEELVQALRELPEEGTSIKALPAPVVRALPSAGPSVAKTHRRGFRLTEEVKAKIVSALKSGEKGAHVAKQFGVSYPTIHAMKSALGLVHSRKALKKRKHAA